MTERLVQTVRKYYNKIIHGIGFTPALIGIVFLILAMLTLELDHTGAGVELNKQVKWLQLKDAETARTIVATVCAGILSLMVFTFSMVVIVMNQAASQMSNRMLDSIIGDKRQKITLGFFMGTIVFALFLLTNISNTQDRLRVPTISVYLLLLLAIADIFLFIYFLNYITQSFRYEQLIQRIHNNSVKSMPAVPVKMTDNFTADGKPNELLSRQSGFYQGFNKDRLLRFAKQNNVTIEFLHCKGSYILKGTPLLKVYGELIQKQLDVLFTDIDFYYGQEIDKNFYYGYFHLAEVAIKALSPGINDPGTATLSIGALTNLFAKLINEPREPYLRCKAGIIRIVNKEWNFPDLFQATMLHIWQYGNKDLKVKQAFETAVLQLLYINRDETIHIYLEQFLKSHINTIPPSKICQ